MNHFEIAATCAGAVIIAGVLAFGYFFGRFARFMKEPEMSAVTDTLKASLDTGVGLADAIAAQVGIALNQLKDATAVATQNASLKQQLAALTQQNTDLTGQVATLNGTIATLQQEADSTNVKNKAIADALTAAGITAPAPQPANQSGDVTSAATGATVATG
jgi:GAF domain-containing protein